MTPTTLESLTASLLEIFEGPFKLTAYRDSGGVLTIGRGHTGPDVHEGMTITQQQAIDLLAKDEAPLFDLVRSFPIPYAAALADFGFNVGKGALQKVLDGQDTVSNPVHTTDRTGKVHSWLVARRNLELQLMGLSDPTQKTET